MNRFYGPLPGSLRRYFGSGWAFLIPYLLAYLLYYTQRWPVSPAVNPGSVQGGFHAPPLLCIYWTLHGLNLLLAAFALWAWWRNPGGVSIPDAPIHRDPAWSRGRLAVLPWFCLALLLFIPGTYLEFPSDPWEHLQRINEWSVMPWVALHSNRLKWSYFLTYSLIGSARSHHQLHWLNFYYTGACLLLCWQYYRLALAVSLGRRSAFLFVLLQLLLLGNSTFSFYRYYGISSTVLAQVGAVAAIRIVLEAMKGSGLRTCVAAAGSLLGTLLLIAFNHPQGLGIAGLGIAAVIFWRLIAWKRSLAAWLGLGALVFSLIAVFCLPRSSVIDAHYRPLGVLTPWYGFNLFLPRSLAGDRMLQITGILGACNLVAAAVLFRRNHVVAWLTLTPLILLSLPIVALPLAGALASGGVWKNFIVFSRMFFAIPPGLALFCFAGDAGRAAGGCGWEPVLRLGLRNCTAPALLLLTVMPSSGPYFNRFWHLLMRPPDDLEMVPAWTALDVLHRGAAIPGERLLLATTGLGAIAIAQKPVVLLCKTRLYRPQLAPSGDLDRIQGALDEKSQASPAELIIPQPLVFYSARSFAAMSSGHWLPEEAVLSATGSRELQEMGTRLSMGPAASSGGFTRYDLQAGTAFK